MTRATLTKAQLDARIADLVERGVDPTRLYFLLPWKDKTVGEVLAAAQREIELLRYILMHDILKTLAKHPPARALDTLSEVAARLIGATGDPDYAFKNFVWMLERRKPDP